MKHTILILLLAAAFGCTKDDTQTTAPSEQATALVQPAPSPSDVLVEVDGEKFTRAQAEEQLGQRITALQSRIPPAQLPEFRARLFNNIIDQFIMRTVLLAEANHQGITVTDEDEKKALDKIRETLPPGLTPEEVMKNSPLGEQRMREEMLLGVKINKLLEKHLTVAADPSDDDIDAFIAENADRLAMPETVRARHILIKVDPSADDAAKAEKRAQIDAIRQQLVDGADFAELAKSKSEGPSAPRGGDLGTFPQGKMVPEFDAAAFSQDLNEIGDIIQTKFGYHVLQVTEKNEAGQVPRERVRKMLGNRNRQQQLADYIDELKATCDIKDSRTPLRQ